ncbi:MAG TPA: diguanylate cyclase [Candidatus Kapabacteria bacterium]|nr:diguanylate cyclase [Candidatus Kapabacteria bacterium]
MTRKRLPDMRNLPVSDPALQREISAVLAGGFRFLRFPDFLEPYFSGHYRLLAVNTLMANTFYLTTLYLLMGVLAFSQYSSEQLQLFPLGYFITGGCLVVTLLFPRLQRFDRWFNWYTGLSTVGALVALMTAAASVEDRDAMTSAHATSIYAVIIVYAMSKMRFYMTVIWCALAGVLHLVLLDVLELPRSFHNFQAYFIAANLIGMGIAYVIEHRERVMFLQALLLDIDKAQQRLLYANLEKLSREDPLTGLANRRYFDERLNMEWNRCQREKLPLSVILLDVDFFKQYNDLYGHQAGDHCLTLIARALRKEASRPAEVVGRYGGEEFIILYPNVDANQIRNTLVRIQQRLLALAVLHEGSRIAKVVTASLGAATAYPVRNLNPEKLVSAADQMLYKSKEAGRNCWFNTQLSPQEPQQQDLINLS